MINIKLCISGLVLLCLLTAAGGASASQCGVLRLQKARSAGVDTIGNVCRDSENLALDSVVQLAPGTRAWFESIADTPNAARFQVICQNVSASPVKIKVAKGFLPWIQAEDVIKCNSWAGDRLECQQPDSGATALLCAIALKKMFAATHEIQRNTSVTMRGKDKPEPPKVLGDNEMEQIKRMIGKEINAQIQSCENLFDQEVAIVWAIEPSGRVAGTSIEGGRVDDQFVACALKVIESHDFPAVPNGIRIYTTFR